MDVAGESTCPPLRTPLARRRSTSFFSFERRHAAQQHKPSHEGHVQGLVEWRWGWRWILGDGDGDGLTFACLLFVLEVFWSRTWRDKQHNTSSCILFVLVAFGEHRMTIQSEDDGFYTDDNSSLDGWESRSSHPIMNSNAIH